MARKTFRDILVEQQGKTVVFTFGRFNPPTIGHEKLISKVESLAKRNRAQAMIFPSFSNDKKKNPLSAKDKIKFLKMLADNPRNIIIDKNVNTPFVALEFLAAHKFDTIIFVVGSDRVKEFQSKMGKYAEELGVLNFKVVSAGARDPDADGVEGMSASKMRQAASSGNYNLFKKGISSKINDRFKKEMFDKVRKGMGLKKINEAVEKPDIQELVGVDFLYFDMQEMFEFSDSFNWRLDNIRVSDVRLCDPNIDYDKAARIAQTANDAWIAGNIFYISEDGFLYGDYERFLACKSRNPEAVIKVKKLGVNIREVFEQAKRYQNESLNEINKEFEKMVEINENL